MAFHLIPDDLVRQTIQVEECIGAVEEAFTQLARGKISNAYGSLDYENGRNSIHIYAAAVPENAIGGKILGAYAKNPSKEKPYIQAVIVLLNPDNGELEALIDGRYITALRTGAATALGAKHLCRPDSRILGIIGTGLQARTHLLCHLAVHTFTKVVIWGRNPQHVATFIGEMQPQIEQPIVALSSAHAVCGAADVVTCVTSSRSALFPPGAARPGTHFAVAAPMNYAQSEFPLELLASSRLFVDSKKKFRRSWHPKRAPEVAGELGELIIGTCSGRQSEEDITVFKPEGMAFEDVVTARIVFERVSAQGEGKTVTDW